MKENLNETDLRQAENDVNMSDTILLTIRQCEMIYSVYCVRCRVRV